MSDGADKRVIQCNVREADARFSAGSRVYVLQLADDRLQVLARSRSGRWIRTWLPCKRLENFRVKTVVADDAVYDRVWSASSDLERAVANIKQWQS